MDVWLPCLRRLLLFLGLFSCQLVQFTGGSYSFPANELSALYDIYTSTNGPHWAWYSTSVKWNFSTSNPNPCSPAWQGIQCTSTCSTSQCHVSSLQLVNLNLQGTIPSTIDKLTRITTFELSNSMLLTGTLPDTIGNFSLLKTLAITNTAVHGQIPLTVGNLSQLTSFKLYLNQFSGTFPQTLTTLSKLTFLYLSKNYRISGQITANLTTLRQLQYFEVDSNQFTGPFPETLCYLPKLKFFTIANNKFTGTLPLAIGLLGKTLTNINIANNHLSGSMPSTITQLNKVRVFYGYSNKFDGRFVDDISSMVALISLQIDDNLFTGPLPNIFLPVFAAVNDIRFSNNFFTGTISPNISYLHTLETFYCEWNLITGQFPNSIIDLNNLDALLFSNNYLSGPVPYILFQLETLSHIFLSNNLFTGPLTPIGFITPSLVEIDFRSNYFTGSVPPTFFANRTFLYYIYLTDNSMTGMIIPNLAQNGDVNRTNLMLTEYFVSENMFSGTITDSIALFTRLKYLNVSQNFLTGTLPTSKSTLGLSLFPPILQSLDCSYNMLTGSLPSLANLNFMKLLFLQNNQFSGRIDGLLDFPDLDYYHHNMTNIDLSDNRLTGSVPASWFQPNSRLKSLALVKNCIRTPLPESLCYCNELEALAFDGLATQTTCQERIFGTSTMQHLFGKSYILHESAIYIVPGMESTNGYNGSMIPPCLFFLPNLTTLHLSGNNMKGKILSDGISDDLRSIAPLMNDLSLSYNQLTGTIPHQIQSRSWKNLDLSFNRLTGTLIPIDEHPETNVTLSLDVNRLSGSIPESYMDIEDIKLLNGNIFECNDLFETPTASTSGTGQLPEHDRDADSYSCGSTSVNRPLLVWAFVVCVIIFIMLIAFVAKWFPGSVIQKSAQKLKFGNPFILSMATALDADSSISSSSQQLLFESVDQPLMAIRRFSIIVTSIIVALYLPIYTILSEYYGSYTYKYVYKVSLVYLSGITPAAVAFCLLVALVLVIEWRLMVEAVVHLDKPLPGSNIPKESNDESDSSSTISSAENTNKVKSISIATVSNEQASMLPWYLRLCFMALVNAVVVLTANGGYVYATSRNSISTEVMAAITFGMTVFKIFWNSVVVTSMMFHYLQDLLMNIMSTSFSTMSISYYQVLLVRYLLSLSLFNLLIAPCLTVAFIRADCFYYVITSSPSISVSYIFSQVGARIYGFDGIPYSPVYTISRTTSFEPPFTYSFQCSFSLLTSFSDIFLYRYLLGNALVPLVLLCCKYIQESVLLKQMVVDFRSMDDRTLLNSNKGFWFISQTLLSSMTALLSVPSTDIDSPGLPSKISVDGANDNIGMIEMNPLSGNIELSEDAARPIRRYQQLPDAWVKVNSLLVLNQFRSLQSHHDVTAESCLSSIPAVQRASQQDIFNGKQFVILIVSDIVLLVSFGAIFPVIAFVVCISVWFTSWQLQLLIHRYMKILEVLRIAVSNQSVGADVDSSNEVLSQGDNVKSEVLLAIDGIEEHITSQCKFVQRLLIRCLRIVTFVAGFFWSLFLFDILGDQVGFVGALWILCIMSTLPVIIWVFAKYYHQRISTKFDAGIAE